MQISIGGSFRIKGGGAYDLTHVMAESKRQSMTITNGGNYHGKEEKYQGLRPERL